MKEKTTVATKDAQLAAYKEFFDAVYEEIYNTATPFNRKINSLMFHLDMTLTNIYLESNKGGIV